MGGRGASVSSFSLNVLLCHPLDTRSGWKCCQDPIPGVLLGPDVKRGLQPHEVRGPGSNCLCWDPGGSPGSLLLHGLKLRSLLCAVGVAVQTHCSSAGSQPGLKSQTGWGGCVQMCVREREQGVCGQGLAWPSLDPKRILWQRPCLPALPLSCGHSGSLSCCPVDDCAS